MCVTNGHDMTLAVIVALNPNTTKYNQFPQLYIFSVSKCGIAW